MINFTIFRALSPSNQHIFEGDNINKALVEERNLVGFSTHVLDLNNLQKSEIPKEFHNITPEGMEELNTTGKTTFTYVQTITVQVEKIE